MGYKTKANDDEENENGFIIRTALERIGRPATLRQVSTFIAREANMPVNQVVPTIRKTLQGGVAYGFVIYQKGRYYNAVPFDQDFCPVAPVVAKTARLVKANGVRRPRGRPSKKRHNVVRFGKPAFPRAYIRRMGAFLGKKICKDSMKKPPRLTAAFNKKVKRAFKAPKRKIRGPGRPPTAKCNLRGVYRRSAPKRINRGRTGVRNFIKIYKYRGKR